MVEPELGFNYISFEALMSWQSDSLNNFICELYMVENLQI